MRRQDFPYAPSYAPYTHEFDVVQVSQPGVEPVTLEEVKLALRIDHYLEEASIEDSLLTSYIKTARLEAENYLAKALVNRQYSMYLSCFPFYNGVAAYIKLPYPPIFSLDAIDYVTETLTYSGGSPVYSSAIDLDTVQVINSRNEIGLLGEVGNAEWPELDPQPRGVRINFTAGYSANADLVPEDIKTAIKIMVGDLYENRESMSPVQIYAIPRSALNMLYYYREPGVLI